MYAATAVCNSYYTHPQEMPVEELSLFKEHVDRIAQEVYQKHFPENENEPLPPPPVEQQQENDEVVVVTAPPLPVIPPLDEKEQFYQRQHEILQQYMDFNNKLK